jgi:hypothetical protein
LLGLRLVFSVGNKTEVQDALCVWTAGSKARLEVPGECGRGNSEPNWEGTEGQEEVGMLGTKLWKASSVERLSVKDHHGARKQTSK